MEGASSVSLDFKTVAYPYPDGGRTEFGIQMARIDTPSIEAISDITIPLSHFAKECGGDYDGWETSIMCDDPGENGDN